MNVLVFSCAAVAPVFAGERSTCDVADANASRAAGDRYRAQARFPDAAQAYLAATWRTHDCRTGSGLMLGAQLLAQAGTAFAQSGDYQRALTLLHAAQARLTSIVAGDPGAAAAAQSTAEVVENVISVVDGIAQASM